MTLPERFQAISKFYWFIFFKFIKTWKLCKCCRKMSSRQILNIWNSEAFSEACWYWLRAGIFMNILLRFLAHSLAIVLAVAWEIIQKRYEQSENSDRIWMHARNKKSLQIVSKKPQQRKKIFRVVQKLSDFFFLRSTCFLENMMYEFQTKDQLSKLTEVPVGYGSFHELSKITVRRKVSP